MSYKSIFSAQVENCKEGLIDQTVTVPFSGTWMGWSNGLRIIL